MNTVSNHIFVFVDLTNDDRLSKYVLAKPGGDDFYREITNKAPVFVITDNP